MESGLWACSLRAGPPRDVVSAAKRHPREPHDVAVVPSSPGALGVVRNLPAGVAAGALHPPVALAVLDPQGEPEHGSLSLGGELTFPAWRAVLGSSGVTGAERGPGPPQRGPTVHPDEVGGVLMTAHPPPARLSAARSVRRSPRFWTQDELSSGQPQLCHRPVGRTADLWAVPVGGLHRNPTMLHPLLRRRGYGKSRRAVC
jgi:hypothetical protein